jgi:hypothetical protein
MASGDAGWWHTVGVLVFVGCWKHAWSVPGAVVLVSLLEAFSTSLTDFFQNILVGSILEPMPALALLTLITATGSLGSYTLSRPLAPLIAVLFPKPLALVRAALAPESIPAPSTSSSTSAASGVITTETITPVQLSSDSSARPIGAKSTSSPTQIWRRLLIMRAMGFVPWSGMNVACGVVGVDWKTFWLTTAAGSASWSYVTASVGNILSRLALPTSNMSGTPSSSASSMADESARAGAGGESLTSLLRDPTLIAKLVFLTLLTLLPVIIKRRRPESTTSSEITSPNANGTIQSERNLISSSTRVTLGGEKAYNPMMQHLAQPASPPLSPITQSLASFTPTPAAFDLLSFGRTVVRQGRKVVGMAGRSAGEGVGRVVGALRG